ncbi:formyltransferase family protein [Flavobacterium sp.]|uniref:formyltransferase family protein n=1 Tax=Flavobacterium sp. TaxID=239 RepID=UPI00404879F5
MKTIIILSEKKWHKKVFINLEFFFPHYNWILIDNKENFNFEILQQINPFRIFIPHWSYIIPKNIYDSFQCIVFHMTDLPYGRGGSPLQNLIVRGHESTKISALKVEKGIDTGPIYLKKELPLNGTAEDIFIRASDIIEQMIIEILNKNLIPLPQNGEITVFKRREPKDSNISNLKTIDEIYNYIRMLDADAYPKAFLEIDNFRFEFSKVNIKTDKSLLANVRIIQK